MEMKIVWILAVLFYLLMQVNLSVTTYVCLPSDRGMMCVPIAEPEEKPEVEPEKDSEEKPPLIQAMSLGPPCPKRTHTGKCVYENTNTKPPNTDTD